MQTKLVITSQDYDLGYHATYVVCANFIHTSVSGSTVKSRLRTINIWKVFLFTLRIFDRNFIFRFSEDYLNWLLNRGLTSNKPVHYLLRRQPFKIYDLIFSQDLKLIEFRFFMVWSNHIYLNHIHSNPSYSNFI